MLNKEISHIGGHLIPIPRGYIKSPKETRYIHSMGCIDKNDRIRIAINNGTLGLWDKDWYRILAIFKDHNQYIVQNDKWEIVKRFKALDEAFEWLLDEAPSKGANKALCDAVKQGFIAKIKRACDYFLNEETVIINNVKMSNTISLGDDKIIGFARILGYFWEPGWMEANNKIESDNLEDGYHLELAVYTANQLPFNILQKNDNKEVRVIQSGTTARVYKNFAEAFQNVCYDIIDIITQNDSISGHRKIKILTLLNQYTNIEGKENAEDFFLPLI